MCTQTDSQPANPQKETIDARCVVKFRPADDWEGEYGFDWFREGDYGEMFMDNNTIDRNYSNYISWTEREDGRTYQIYVKANSDYKNDGLIGKYGMTIDYFTRSGKTSGFKTEIYEKKRFLSNKNNKYYYTDYDGDLCYLDPDLPPPYGSRTRLDLTQINASGNIINADLFSETNYSYIDIVNANTSNSTSGNSRRNKYYVPFISLLYTDDSNSFPEEYKGCKANVKLIIRATGIKKLKFVTNVGINIFRVDNTTGIVSQNKITDMEIQSQTEENVVIELSKEFFNYSLSEGDGYIKVYALHQDDNTETLAGKLCVVKSIPKIVNILFVPINVRLGGSVSLSNRDIVEDKKRLKKYLSHAHIVPNIKLPVCNLETEKKLFNIVYSHKKPVTNQSGVAVKEVIEVGPDLIKQLESTIDDEFPLYEDYYKIFIINVEGNCSGMAFDIPSKSAVVLKHDRQKNPSTICHELLHCFGLFHVFSNESPFTFERYKTSNIMDYRFSNIGFIRHSSWKWQWDKIRLAKGEIPKEKNFIEKLLPII